MLAASTSYVLNNHNGLINAGAHDWFDNFEQASDVITQLGFRHDVSLVPANAAERRDGFAWVVQAKDDLDD